MLSDGNDMTVDAHHHLWRYAPEEFDWLDGPMRALRKDFLVDDLRAEMSRAGVQAAVSVQARQSLEETRWLLELAKHTDRIRGVVGWAPIASGDFPSALDEFAGEEKLKGLRHVIQGEPDDNYILRPDFNRGIAGMLDMGLVYDILVFARHLPQTITFVDRHPRQRFVLDHIAKPSIGGGVSPENSLEPWATNLRELAKRDNVTCKLSGIVTEANWGTWSLESLRPYLDVVVESFGTKRLLAGSDWPVCLVASGYAQWFDTLRTYFAGFSESEKQAVFGGNAVAVYNL